jgi:hypothetical protein
VFVNFMWLFVSQDVTIVSVYMTIPMEGCLVQDILGHRFMHTQLHPVSSRLC